MPTSTAWPRAAQTPDLPGASHALDPPGGKPPPERPTDRGHDHRGYRYRKVGGGRERGIAVLNRSVMLPPRGVDPVIASHELTHVELHARLAEVPQRFDEGLAVLVGDDPRDLAPSGIQIPAAAATTA